MSTSIEGIMCLWNEEDNVARAIESTKDFVDSYLVVDDSDDSTLDIVRECQQRWGLDMKILYKPGLPDLAEKRFWAFQRAKADWLLVVDGDHVFHTDGPNAIQQIRPQLEEVQRNVVWVSTSIWLWGSPGDFTTWREPWGRDGPMLIPHPFLYRNSPQFYSEPKKTGDLPRLPYAQRIDFPNQPAFWDVCCKNPKRLFLRTWLVRWRKAEDYKRFPTLESFVQGQYQENDLSSRVERWWADQQEFLQAYDPEKFGYYPKVLREIMGRK